MEDELLEIAVTFEEEAAQERAMAPPAVEQVAVEGAGGDEAAQDGGQQALEALEALEAEEALEALEAEAALEDEDAYDLKIRLDVTRGEAMAFMAFIAFVAFLPRAIIMMYEM